MKENFRELLERLVHGRRFSTSDVPSPVNIVDYYNKNATSELSKEERIVVVSTLTSAYSSLGLKFQLDESVGIDPKPPTESTVPTQPKSGDKKEAEKKKASAEPTKPPKTVQPKSGEKKKATKEELPKPKKTAKPNPEEYEMVSGASSSTSQPKYKKKKVREEDAEGDAPEDEDGDISNGGLFGPAEDRYNFTADSAVSKKKIEEYPTRLDDGERDEIIEFMDGAIDENINPSTEANIKTRYEIVANFFSGFVEKVKGEKISMPRVFIQ